MDLYTPPTPVSPNSRPVSGYTRPSHHYRKRISALRLSSDTTSTLPEYIPTNPISTKVTEATEIEDAPPGYPDSAEEADEDTDLSEDDRRKSVFIGINSAPHTAASFSPRISRFRQGPPHRRKRSNPTLTLDPIRSNSDLYLDSLLERSVHALEMSNALLQSSISTKTSLSGILHQETDEEENMPLMTSSPRPGSSSGMHSLERSARGLSSRILRNRDVHETWVEDLEQISRDVDQLFSEDTQGGRKNRTQTRRNGSGSGSSQGSISASLPVTSSSPLQSYQSHRHRTSISAAGPSHQRISKHVRRRSSLDLHSRSQGMSSPEAAESRDPEHSERHDDLAGVPHLRYDIQDRERFIAHPPRALTQYVVAEGNLRHGHEEVNGTIHHRPHHSEKHRNSDEGKRGKIVREQDSRNHQASEPRDDDDNDDDGEETIRLPSTLGLRSSGTYSTLRGSRRSPSRSRSRSPEHIQSRPGPSVLTAPAPRIIVDSTSSPSSSSHQPTRAPNAYNMLSSFVYPTSTSSIPARSNSTSSTSRTKGKNSPFGSPWGSIRGPATMAEKPAFESNSPRHGGSGFTRRRHSTSPAASVLSTKTSRSGGSGSSTVTSGSGSRSRSQTPKPLETGFTFLPAVGRRCMTPPLEGSGESRSSLEGSGHSSDSCPTKQTILSLRKILDTHNPPAKPPSDDWTLISKPPRLLQQPLKTGLPAEAGTSTATASISKLFTRGVHSHEGSVTRIRTDEQKYSSFKGKGKSSANNTSVPPTPTTPTPVSTPALNNKMNFSMSFPEFLSTGVALALGGPSPLSSKPSSGTSTPATPGHSKRISFAELPEGTQGTGPERRSKKRKGKQRASSRRSGNDSLKGSRKSGKRHSGSDEDGDEPKGWLGWLIGVSGVDSGRSDKIDERLGKSWGNLNSASRGPGYGGGLDEWGM